VWQNVQADYAVLDAELVILDPQGRPDFYALAQREHVGDSFRYGLLAKTMPATLVVFDLLQLGRQDVTHRPLIERKELLKGIIRESERLVLCFYTEGGRELYEVAQKKKLEGVMGKQRQSLYYPGKRKACWLKVKMLKTLDVVIGGYTVGTGWRQKYFGALLCGVYYQGKLRYVGRVGTGLDERGYARLTRLLQHIQTRTSPFEVCDLEPAILQKVRWVKPRLVAEVRFMSLSPELKMRAPSFRRLRTDKPPRECTLEADEAKRLMA
jgi:bifunctional non-homologous end joining protein LigD